MWRFVRTMFVIAVVASVIMVVVALTMNGWGVL